MTRSVRFELDCVIPWSRWGKTLRFFVAEHGCKALILRWYRDLFLFIVSFNSEVSGRPTNSALRCQLFDDVLFCLGSELGNGGAFLYRIYASQNYGKISNINSAVSPAEFGFKCS